MHEEADSGSAELGASSAEYGLLITAIAVVTAMVVFAFGGAVLDLFSHTCGAVVGRGASSGSC